MIGLLKYLKGYYAQSIFAPIFKLIEAISELAVPLLIASMIDVGIANGDVQYIINYGLIVALLALTGLGFATLCQYMASKVAMRFGTAIRADLFRHINALSHRELDKFGGSSLITRLTSDVTGCQNALGMFLRLVMRTPFVVIGALVMAIIIDYKLSLIFFGMTLLIVGALYLVMSRCTPKFREAQVRLDEVNRLTSEGLKGARVIRAFKNESKSIDKFSGAATDSAKTSIAAGLISGLSSPVTFALCNFAVIAVLWFGSKQVYYGDLSQGQIIALVNYLTQIYLAVTAFASIILTFTRANACASRVRQVLDTPSSIVDDGTDTAVDFNAPITLEFKNVSFAYDGDNALDGISFKLENGKSLGIIGGTGAGKTTLVSLIERFYSPSSGEIEFCSKPVTDYTLNAMRDAIGYVPQRARLISGTLAENLKVANQDATDEQIHRALTVAQANELLLRLGKDDLIQEGGVNLSGGQRQRLTIARALMKERALLILDDSSSALDYATERALYDAIDALSCARIIVSQRVSSVQRCDNILVLDDGKVLAYGTNDSLMESCALYKELYQTQTEASA